MKCPTLAENLARLVDSIKLLAGTEFSLSTTRILTVCVALSRFNIGVHIGLVLKKYRGINYSWTNYCTISDSAFLLFDLEFLDQCKREIHHVFYSKLARDVHAQNHWRFSEEPWMPSKDLFEDLIKTESTCNCSLPSSTWKICLRGGQPGQVI